MKNRSGTVRVKDLEVRDDLRYNITDPKTGTERRHIEGSKVETRRWDYE